MYLSKNGLINDEVILLIIIVLKNLNASNNKKWLPIAVKA